MSYDLEKTPPAIRLSYAGAINLLAQAAAHADEDDRLSMVRAVEDWCAHSGWAVEDHGAGELELIPPP